VVLGNSSRCAANIKTIKPTTIYAEQLTFNRSVLCYQTVGYVRRCNSWFYCFSVCGFAISLRNVDFCCDVQYPQQICNTVSLRHVGHLSPQHGASCMADYVNGIQIGRVPTNTFKQSYK
jgi:hypothetical protein